MAEEAQERTEEATARRRSDARKKGTVAKSMDLTNSLVMFGLLLMLPWAISRTGAGLMEAMRIGTSQIPGDLSNGSMQGFALKLFQPAIPGLVGIVILAMALGLASNFAQVGFIMSPEALVPNFGKINPLSGFKRLFGVTTLFEGMKATAKSLIFAFLAYSALKSNWDDLIMLNRLSPDVALSTVGSILRSMTFRVVMAWGALAGFDYFFQRSQVNKQLRMTKQQVKQEMKESDGSPEVKAALAQKRRKMRRNRGISAVKDASVIITNPTHYAVALKYEPGKMGAPQLIAKGKDLLAAKIREEAKLHRIPIVANPPLARAIYKQCEVEDFVPRELFQAVAEVLAVVYRTLKRVGG